MKRIEIKQNGTIPITMTIDVPDIFTDKMCKDLVKSYSSALEEIQKGLICIAIELDTRGKTETSVVSI